MLAAMVAFSLVCSLLLGEGVLRLLAPARLYSPLIQVLPHNRQTIELEDAPDGVSPTARYSTNRLGFRGDEPPRDWASAETVLAIGGSTTQCFYLDDARTWPVRLQQKLRPSVPRIWVANGGLDGHSTRGHLLFVRDVLAKVRPKFALFLVGINDLGLSLDDRARTAGSDFDRPSGLTWQQRLAARSRLFQVAWTWKQILFQKAYVVRVNRLERMPPHPLAKPEPESGDLRDRLPQLSEYRKNLGELIRACRELRVRPIFLTQPFQYGTSQREAALGIDLYWLKRSSRQVSVATLRRMLDVYNAELSTVCQKENCDMIDLAREISGSSRWFYDGVHFNEPGAERIAEVIAQAVARIIASGQAPD